MVSNFGSEVSCFVFQVSRLEFRVWGPGFQISGFGVRASGFGFMVQGLVGETSTAEVLKTQFGSMAASSSSHAVTLIRGAPSCSPTRTDRFYLTQKVFKVVFQNSTPTQIRQLILYIGKG